MLVYRADIVKEQNEDCFLVAVIGLGFDWGLGACWKPLLTL